MYVCNINLPADELGRVQHGGGLDKEIPPLCFKCLLFICYTLWRLNANLSCLVVCVHTGQKKKTGFVWNPNKSKKSKACTSEMGMSWVRRQDSSGADRRRENRRAAGGRSCHQWQRIMVGEVKIKARGRRLAPQPWLSPPSLALIGVTDLKMYNMCECRMLFLRGGGYGGGLRGMEICKWVTGVAAVIHAAYLRSTITRVEGHLSTGCAMWLPAQQKGYTDVSLWRNGSVWTGRGETCWMS